MSIVYIVSAPSGSGKSTLVNELFKMVRGLDFSISYTTRLPRGSEQNGKEYFFVSREEFEAMIADDKFLEYAEVFGDEKVRGEYYGTARRFLREAENRSNDLLLDIDVQGASKIKEKIPEAVSIFILPPDREKLEWRLRTRGLDLEDVIRRRLDTARREIENYSKYDYILVNNELEKSADQLRDIVLSVRLQRSGAKLSVEDKRRVEVAQACRLEEARERVQPILASFNPQRQRHVEFQGREL
jgi:guanylate kinase